MDNILKIPRKELIKFLRNFFLYLKSKNYNKNKNICREPFYKYQICGGYKNNKKFNFNFFKFKIILLKNKNILYKLLL